MGRRIDVNLPTPEPGADAGGSRATGRWRSVGPTRDAIRLYQWPSQAARLFGCRARNPSGPAARRRTTGRTHDRIRTAADTRSHSPEPRWVRQDDHTGSEIKIDNHSDAGLDRPARPSMAGWLAALKDASRRARTRWPREGARPSLTAANQPASEASGRGRKTALQPNRKTWVQQGSGRIGHAPQDGDIPMHR